MLCVSLGRDPFTKLSEVGWLAQQRDVILIVGASDVLRFLPWYERCRNGAQLHFAVTTDQAKAFRVELKNLACAHLWRMDYLSRGFHDLRSNVEVSGLRGFSRRSARLPG